MTLSNYCHGCELGPEPKTGEFQDWEKSHQGKCQKNIHYSSQAMEVEAALILRRSEDHNLRHIEMLGDGDGKAYAKINAAEVYGGRWLYQRLIASTM